MIDHGYGVVIGETAEIGDNCILYQGVTLGGTGKDIGKRHPTLESDVMVSAGAKVLGPLTIGTGSKIGAGSVVLKSVPPHSTVVGVPGRIVKQEGKRVSDMDQVKLPDPILEELKRLNDRIYELEKSAGIKTCRYSLTMDENNMRPDLEADCNKE
jgi:serine O-acetyltransferase